MDPAAAAWREIRTIIAPQDVVGVRPRAPSVRCGTGWHPRSDTAAPTTRCGEREWFSDHLFVESRDGHAGTGYGTSISAHVIFVVGLAIFSLTRPDQAITVARPASLVMPAIASPPPSEAIAAPPSATPEQPKPKPLLQPPAPPPPARTPDPEPAAAAPVDAPTGIAPETGSENRVAAGGVPGGVAGGIPGGVVGGVVGGAGPSGSGTGNAVRVGPSMQAPRKIRDVTPIYPAGALPTRSQGAVIIEATIGPDGKVQNAKVIHSVPGLDQAALDAVRQWEYTPSLLNGAPVAVVLTVIVNFAMQ